MARIWGCVRLRLCRPVARWAAAVPLCLSVLGLALAGQVVLAAPAAAHARMVGSSPEDGTTIDRAPGQVTIQLDAKPATIEGDPLQVYGPGGRRVDAADPHASDDGRRLSVSLDRAQDLASGEYEIVYRVVSADTHVIAGRLSFSTRSPRPADGPADPGQVVVGHAWAPFEARSGDDTLASGSRHLIAGGPHDIRPPLVAAGALVLAVISLSVRRLRRPRPIERSAPRSHPVPPGDRSRPRRPVPSGARTIQHRPRRRRGPPRVRADLGVPAPGPGAFWEATAAAAGRRPAPQPPSAGSRGAAVRAQGDDRYRPDSEVQPWF
jgi:methionine-rich copper-binding protein CopC